MPTQDRVTYFGETNFRNRRVKFGIKTDDRRRHMYVIGKTGMGKSTLLENMVLDDIYAGNGVCYVDPHGDTVERFLDFIPPSRINDVVYFNPADVENPVALNILEKVDENLQHIVASGLLGVFKKLWADSWGPRLEYVLRNAILALLDYPGSTLLGIMRILTDNDYRKKVTQKIKDPVVRSFWVDEYERYPDKFKVEVIAPIQNKVGQFLSNFLIRNIVGQVKSTMDIRRIMDEKKILFLNLSKGRIGEDTSSLLGAMMITKIQLAAMSRVDTLEKERQDFYLYVDEFQNFATESFANILSEARKYHLDLIIAHQYIEQLDETVAAAVFGNVGTLLTFRIGAGDAETLVKEFEPVFTELDLVNLKKYDFYLRLMIDGVASEPFSGTGLAPFYLTLGKQNNQEKVIKVSREHYSKPRSVVEEKIARWASTAQVLGASTQNEPRGQRSNSGGGQRGQQRYEPRTPRSDSGNGQRWEPRGQRSNSGGGQRGQRSEQGGNSRSYTEQGGNENRPRVIRSNRMSEEELQLRDTRAHELNQKNTKTSMQPKMRTQTPQPQPQPKTQAKKSSASSEYLGTVAKQQAQMGIKQEQGVVDRDPDGPTPNRNNATQCWSCNKLTYVSFMPDGQRPVYCKNCLHDMRLKKAAEIEGKQLEIAEPPQVKALQEPTKREPLQKKKNIISSEPKKQRIEKNQKKPLRAPKNQKGVQKKQDSKDQNEQPKKLAPGQVIRFDS